MPISHDVSREARIAALQNRVAALQHQRRSWSEFREWKPDTIFYYLFVLALVVFLAWSTWPRGRSSFELLSIPASVLLFGLLCCASRAVNRLRYWVGFRRPNQRLDREMEPLRAEIRRLQNGE